MKKFTFLIVVLCFSQILFAQTEIIEPPINDSLNAMDAIDSTQILTNVNVFKDPRLNILKQRPELVARNKAKEELIEKRNEKLGVKNIRNYNSVNRGTRKVTGSIVTRKGYRVVIYSGSDRSEALNMKRKFMRSYPGTQSYLSYISPSYKIRVGDFASKTDAYKFLRSIQRAGFSNSFVVPDIVTIKDINVR